MKKRMWGESGYQRLQVWVEMDWCWLSLGVPAISCTRDREKKRRKELDDCGNNESGGKKSRGGLEDKERNGRE